MLGFWVRHCVVKGPHRILPGTLYSNTQRPEVWTDTHQQYSHTRSKETFTQHTSCMQPLQTAYQDVLEATDPQTEQILANDMLVYQDFITEAEEKSLIEEVEPYLKRLRYEHDHWDDAIHGYRETERKHWKQENKSILQKMRDVTYSSHDKVLPYIHVLDLHKSGCVKPHIDSTRFCGSTLGAICLMSSCVMRLVQDQEKTRYGDIFLKRRSLYIMRGRARYEYTHEILPEEESFFRGQAVSRNRRVSIIMRTEPTSDKAVSEKKGRKGFSR